MVLFSIVKSKRGGKHVNFRWIWDVEGCCLSHMAVFHRSGCCGNRINQLSFNCYFYQYI